MNKCNEMFLENNGIDTSTRNSTMKIFSQDDINEVLTDRYAIEKGRKNDKTICMKDLVGYNYSIYDISPNLVDSLDSFFDSKGDGYHSRAVGLLKYSTEELIEVLKTSYIQEPIKTLEVDDGKHIISSNGLHRFTVLKIHYLNAIKKCNSEEEIKKVNEEFSIPVISDQVDLIKTYSKYLIEKAQPYSMGGKKIEEVKEIRENEEYEITFRIRKQRNKKNDCFKRRIR